MIQSMTGFGKATAAFKTKKINVEIKSLNSKTLDLSTRIAPLYREKEMEIRQYISKNLERGKVDFAIWIDKDAMYDTKKGLYATRSSCHIDPFSVVLWCCYFHLRINA